MKRIFSLLFIAVLAFSLISCSVVDVINNKIIEASNICVAASEESEEADTQEDAALPETDLTPEVEEEIPAEDAGKPEDVQNVNEAETEPETEPEAEAEQEPENEWKPSMEHPEPSDTEYCHFVKLGEGCSYDLDGDGQPEEITVHAITEGQEDYPDCKYQLKINDIEYKDVFVPSYSSPYYCIIDIDAENPGYHLAFQDYGMSADYCTTILEYSKGVLIETGIIPGVFDDFTGFGDTVCNGDSTISTVLRMGALQTWYGEAEFRLSDGMLDMVSEDYHKAVDIGCNYSSQTLKVDLPVYADKSLNSEKTVIAEGSQVTLLGCDDGEWIRIKAQDEKEYWFAVDDEFFTSVVIDGEAVEGNEVFSNLFFAD